MEVTLVSTSTVKIKGKQSSFVVNPVKSVKTGADGVILLTSSSNPGSLLSHELAKESRVVIQGPGEYEVGGTKISGVKYADDTVFTLFLDNMEVLVGRADAIEKVHSKLQEHQVVISSVPTETNSASTILSINPRIIIVYGDKAKSVVTELGSEDVKPVTKYNITGDKMPAELEVVLLG